MATITVTINGQTVAHDGLYLFADSQLGAGNYRSVSGLVTNNGPGSITINSMSAVTWGRNIRLVPGVALPAVVASGNTLAFTAEVYQYPIEVGYRAGSPFSRWSIVWDDGSSHTHSVDLAARIKRAVPSSAYAAPSFDTTFREWAIDMYSFVTAASTAANPTGAGWHLETLGHMRVGETYVSYTLRQGQRAFLFFNPWSATQYLGSQSDLQFDAYVEAQEYSNKYLWSSWIQMLDWLQAFPETSDVYVYTGTMRQDPHFLNFLTTKNIAGFVDRAQKSIGHLIGRARTHLCLDAPDLSSPVAPNFAVAPGEPRWDYMNGTRKLLARRGNRTYAEPRPLAAKTFWHGAAGFGLITFDAAYTRSNPAWFSDSSTSATDAQLGDVIRMCADQTQNLFPYMIADTIAAGQRFAGAINQWCLPPEHSGWNLTLKELYVAVKNILLYIERP